MNELLQAAKAVIDADDIPTRCNAISKLRAAVDRAEKQDAVGFDEWWDANADLKYKFVPIGQAKQLWTAAQQAERERLKEIIKQFSSECSEDGEWVRCCNELLEKIDVPE